MVKWVAWVELSDLFGSTEVQVAPTLLINASTWSPLVIPHHGWQWRGEHQTLHCSVCTSFHHVQCPSHFPVNHLRLQPCMTDSQSSCINKTHTDQNWQKNIHCIYKKNLHQHRLKFSTVCSCNCSCCKHPKSLFSLEFLTPKKFHFAESKRLDQSAPIYLDL